jgi:hypothetical protein
MIGCGLSMHTQQTNKPRTFFFQKSRKNEFGASAATRLPRSSVA